MATTDYDHLRRRYASFFEEEPTGEVMLDHIEAALHTTLPDDFKKIAQFYSGGMLGGISHHAISTAGPATNVVEETLRLRATIDLPERFVVLAEPSESLIVLNSKAAPNYPAVIWCDAHDAVRLNVPEAILKSDTWKSYADFFLCLLNLEVEEREAT